MRSGLERRSRHCGISDDWPFEIRGSFMEGRKEGVARVPRAIERAGCREPSALNELREDQGPHSRSAPYRRRRGAPPSALWKCTVHSLQRASIEFGQQALVPYTGSALCCFATIRISALSILPALMARDVRSIRAPASCRAAGLCGWRRRRGRDEGRGGERNNRLIYIYVPSSCRSICPPSASFTPSSY